MIVTHREPDHFPSDYASMYSKIFPNLYFLFFLGTFPVLLRFQLISSNFVPCFRNLMLCRSVIILASITLVTSLYKYLQMPFLGTMVSERKGKSGPKLFTSLTLARIWDVLLSTTLFYTNYIVQFCLSHATSRQLLLIFLLHQKLLGKYLHWQWRRHNTY